MMKRVYDFYLRFSFGIDLVLAFMLMVLTHFIIPYAKFNINTNELGDFLSSLISTCVSLAGFILAALTIIVTFRSNVQIKNLNEATDGMKLILASNHYYNIISVFKKSIIELVFCAMILTSTWLIRDSYPTLLTPVRNIYVIEYSLVAIFFSILRSLHILFLIMDLEKSKEEK